MDPKPEIPFSGMKLHTAETAPDLFINMSQLSLLSQCYNWYQVRHTLCLSLFDPAMFYWIPSVLLVEITDPQTRGVHWLLTALAFIYRSFISNLPIRDHLHGWLYKLNCRWLCYWCPYFLIQPVTGLRCSLRMTQTILPVVLFSPAFSRFPRVKSRFWTKNCASSLV